MSHRVPNISFCWQQASVDRQMSTGKCLSANCLKESRPVPTCFTESQTVASVGDRQVSTGKCQQASVCQQTVSKSPNLSQHVAQIQKQELLLMAGKCGPANVIRQVYVGKLSLRVPTCPSMSCRVPNISFCWRQASVDQQMSTGKCLLANCLKESPPVPACLTESQTVASVGDRQVLTGKCQWASVC